MKKIHITEIQLPFEQTRSKRGDYIKQNLYNVYLGNEVRIYFKQEKEAKAFLTETNRFLNKKLFEINYVFTRIFVCYQEQAWFYLEIEKPDFDLENDIEDNIKYTKKMLTLLVQKRGNNSNHFAFVNMMKALFYIKEIINKLNQLFDSRKMYNQLHFIEMQLEYLGRIEIEIESWAKTKYGEGQIF